MPYIRERCVAGNTIEINKYFCYRVHTKGEKRSKKEKLTTEAQKKVNQRKAGKELRWMMNANFVDGDSLVRLDFFKKPVNSTEMQAIMQKVIRQLRAEYRKQGRELKYIYVKEVGPRGGRHIHMIVNKVDTDTLRKVWPYGGIHVDPLISNGQYRKIAEYFIKYAAITEKSEGKIVGKRWYSSRNLIRPVPVKEIIPAATFRKTVKEKPGYYLEKESLQYGISEVTGFEYFSYTLIKADQQMRGG